MLDEHVVQLRHHCRMTIAAGSRISWTDWPLHVRQGVESILDDTVVEAIGHSGGFSPGTADRIRNPALPTVRRFQRLQGEAATHWLRQRIG